jgi:hypothetical protein
MFGMTLFVAVALLSFLCVSLAGGAVTLTAAPSLRGKGGKRQGVSAVDDARLISEIEGGGGTGGVSAPAPAFNRPLSIPRASIRPEIDGRFDAPEWAEGALLEGFSVAQRYNAPGLPRPSEATTVARVLHDDDGLYVAVAAYQDPSTIYTTIKENGWLRPDLDWESRGEPWANTGCDEIEIAIDPELTLCEHYTFQINPQCVTRKLYMPHARAQDGLYKRIDPIEVHDADWRAATARDEHGWYVTAFIPWESIGFERIRPVAPNDVMIKMIQQRTLMGFNVHRVAHELHEPSSWSPSRGPFFFRDVENFGLASFAPAAVGISGVTFSDVLADRIDASFTVDSRAECDAAFKAALSVDGKKVGKAAAFKLASGAAHEMTLSFPRPAPGRHAVELAVAGADKRIAARAAYVFDVPDSVVITTRRSVLYTDESDLPVGVKFALPDGAADSVKMRILSRGKVVASTDTDIAPEGSRTAALEVTGLKTGAYQVEAVAMKGRKQVASGCTDIRVMPSPFSLKLKGRAGKASSDKGGAEGFGVLGKGTPGARRAKVFSGELSWLSKTDSERGFVAYAVTATADFETDAPPRRAQLGAPVRAFAAGGEYEGLAFAVFATGDVGGVTVEAGELVSVGGKKISAEHTCLRAERPDGFLVAPEVMGALAAGSGRRYFLNVYVAPGTAAGKYRGKVAISAGGAPVELAVELLVLPFELEGALSVGSIYGLLCGTKRDEPMAADLRAHGLDNLTCVHPFNTDKCEKVMIHHLLWDLPKPTEENWLGDSPERFAVKLDAARSRNMKRLGFTGPIVIDVNYFIRYVPCTAENAVFFEGVLKRIEAMREKYGLDEFVYHLVDEPSNHFTYDDGRYGRRYGLQRVHFYGKVLKKLGLRQYLTVNSTGKGFDTAAKISDVIDIWCPNSISDEKQVVRWTAPGKELWLYNYAGDGRVKGAGRSTYGFYAERVHATGVTIWHHPGYVRWEEDESGGCIGSAGWEGIREGRDDARYIATLKNAIARAAKQGGKAARDAAKAERDLAAIVDAYPVLTPDKVRFERLFHADDWNKWRWTLARWILKLTGKI